MSISARMRAALGFVGWTLFWVLLVAGVALLVVEWQMLERSLGL